MRRQQSYFIIVLLLSVSVVCVSAQSEDNRTELHISFITSFGGDFDSSIATPAVRLAADKINEDETILPGYRLVMQLVDNRTVASNYANSECNWINSQRTFLEQITSGQSKVALIGCGCSIATEIAAVSSNFFNITHISYTPTSEILSNRELFPNVWKMFPQPSSISSPIMSILAQYSWTKLKVITQSENVFRESTDSLVQELTAQNITVDTSGTTFFFTESNVSNLTESELFPEEVRVYFLNMYPTYARRIMCRAAYNQRTNPNPEHHYPGYVWITLGWYRDDWWREAVANDNQIQCSDNDLEPLIRNTLSIQLGNATTDMSVDTNVGITTAEFEEEIRQMLEYQPSGFSTVAYHAYDAVWTLARAINRTLPSVSDDDLRNFDYQTRGGRVTNLISAVLNNTFVGVSGSVSFDENGARLTAAAKILKYYGSSKQNACGQTAVSTGIQRYVIARDNGSMFVYLTCENDGSAWPDGIPSDGTPIVVLTTFFTPLYIVYNIAVILGIAFAIVCLLFNCIFRNRQIVRLISPNLNYIIILGAILLYISVTFFVFPTTSPLWTTFACHFRIWTQTLGYFMCFGTIVAKMWRIYLIFYRRKVEVTSGRQMAVKDWHLVLIVVAMCSVVIIIGIAVAIFGDYKAVQVPDRERPITRNENNVLFEKHNLVCQGPRDLIWIVILYAYILLTQLIAVFLAFRTRKVEIKILNDAKYIAIIIYLTSIIITIMIVCAVLLSNFLNADGAVFGGLIYIFITTVLCVLFIPKMVILYKDPQGKKIMQEANVHLSDETAVTFAANKDAIVIAFNQEDGLNKDAIEKDDTKVVNGTNEQGGTKVVNGTNEQGGTKVVNGTNEQGGTKVVNGTDEQDNTKVANGTNEQDNTKVANGTNEQDNTKVANETNKQCDTKVANGTEVANGTDKQKDTTDEQDDITDEQDDTKVADGTDEEVSDSAPILD